MPNQRACSVLANSEKVRHCIFCPTCSGGSSLLVRHFAAAACSALKQSQTQIPPVDKGVPDCNQERKRLISKRSLVLRYFGAGACPGLKQGQTQIPPVDKGIHDCNEEWRGLINKWVHACSTSATSDKPAPDFLEHVPFVFWGMYLLYFDDFCYSWPGVPISMPAAPRQPQKKCAPTCFAKIVQVAAPC